MPNQTEKVSMTAARTKSGLLWKSPLQDLVLSTPAGAAIVFGSTPATQVTEPQSRSV